jgi:sugar phosphate permease
VSFLFIDMQPKMNLVCDDNWWPSLCTTLFYTGSLFGNLLFGWIADK